MQNMFQLFLLSLYRPARIYVSQVLRKYWSYCINPLNTKRRLLYLKTQFVPRSKHFSSRL